MRRLAEFTIRRFLASAGLGIIMAGTLALYGCSNGVEKKDTLSAMQLKELVLSEEDQKLVSMIDTHNADKIFRYRMDGKMKYLSFTVEELKDGKLTVLAQAGSPAASEGIFAVIADTNEITLSWDEGRYTCPLDSVYGYKSNIACYLTDLSDVSYNRKEAVFMIAGSSSDMIESSDVTDYHNLISLEDKNYDRVFFVTAAFLDFEPKDELAFYNGIVRDKSSLSPDTIKWLEKYNQMDIYLQPSLSYMPIEFMELSGEIKPGNSAAGETEESALIPVT